MLPSTPGMLVTLKRYCTYTAACADANRKNFKYFKTECYCKIFISHTPVLFYKSHALSISLIVGRHMHVH